MRVIEDATGQDPTIGNYHFARVEPSPRLRPLVREYMGYADEAANRVRLRELPIADTVVIINLGAKWRLLDPADERLLSEHDSFAAGLADGVLLDAD